MIVDLFGVKGLFTSLITRGFVESHLKDKLKFEVVPTDDVGQKFKDAVKKEYNANFLGDSDFVVRFVIPKVEQKPEEDNEESDTKADVEKDDENKTDKKTNKKEDNAETEQDEVDESVKVQDLSKSLGLQMIGAKKQKTQKCVKEHEKKRKDKITKTTEGKIEEAETTATGAELKKKIIQNIKRTFHSSDENIELNDLNDYLDGYDVCFVKIGLNNKKKDEQ